MTFIFPKANNEVLSCIDCDGMGPTLYKASCFDITILLLAKIENGSSICDFCTRFKSLVCLRNESIFLQKENIERLTHLNKLNFYVSSYSHKMSLSIAVGPTSFFPTNE